MKTITKILLMISIIHIIGCSAYHKVNNGNGFSKTSKIYDDDKEDNNGNTVTKSFKIYDENKEDNSKVIYTTKFDYNKNASLRIILIPSKMKVAKGEEIVLSIFVTNLSNKPVLFPASPLSYEVEAQFQRYTDKECFQVANICSEVSVSNMNINKILPFDTKEFRLKWKYGKNIVDKNIIGIKVKIANRIETNSIFILTRPCSKR